MTRHSIVRVLLSLLLLMSQQMATSHAMSHLGTARAAAALVRAHTGELDDVAKALAQDQTCNQCLAFAQLAAPLGNTPRMFAPAELVASVRAAAASQPGCARTVCVFQSRAPPVAA
ncbi:MAG: hypothetical protein V4508_24955 [Pseudomonadota bacterium]